jgi:hypothetical protein
MDTSLAASKAIVPHLARLEAAVLNKITTAANGATDYEIECWTNLRHQTASARRRGLVLKGLVEDSGLRRNTDSGRAAVVWRVRR